MNHSIFKVAVIFVFLLVLSVPESTRAMMAADLQNLRIIGHHFTTSVSSDKRVNYSKHPADTRIVVFKFSASISSNDGILFTNDFVLRYTHENGKEDRSAAIRICTAKTSVIGEESNCLISKTGWVNVGSGDVMFTVAFFLENDVKNIEIHMLGRSDITSYTLSGERPYSVFISTNQGSEYISGIIDVIKIGGYRVLNSSLKLDPEEEGITIYYIKSVETQAREISQRIMTKIQAAPALKENKFPNSDSDVVIWVGKPSGS